MAAMKRALILYTKSDSKKAEQLQDFVQLKIGSILILRSIKDVLTEDQKLKDELPRSDGVALIGSRQASSFLHNQRTEIEDGFETFDGKLIEKELTENKDLQKRLVIVFFTERTKNDWIPAGFDERRIFHLQGDKIRGGNPDLDMLVHFMEELWIEKIRV